MVSVGFGLMAKVSAGHCGGRREAARLPELEVMVLLSTVYTSSCTNY